jgi:hypothetical protein
MELRAPNCADHDVNSMIAGILGRESGGGDFDGGGQDELGEGERYQTEPTESL